MSDLDMNKKLDAEMNWWKTKHAQEDGVMRNGWYQELLLSVANREKSYFDGKVVADFGCGPRGSLEWADNSAHRYCIDVLADRYVKELGADKHKAEYVKSTENKIPLASDTVDVIFSINSIDHAEDPDIMVDEIFRVLKPGGFAAFSVNIDEPPTPAEPHTLTDEFVRRAIEAKMDVEHKVIANRVFAKDSDNPRGGYAHLHDYFEKGIPVPPYNGKFGVCWIAGLKKQRRSLAQKFLSRAFGSRK